MIFEWDVNRWRNNTIDFLAIANWQVITIKQNVKSSYLCIYGLKRYNMK